MQISLIVYGSINNISGGYLYDRKLIKALSARGHSVTVTSPQNTWGHGADLYIIDELCHPHFFRRRHWAADAPVAAIIHHLRACEGWAPIHWYMERKFLHHVDYAIYPSAYTRHSVAAMGYGGRGRIVPPGTEEGEVDPSGVPPLPLHLVCVGNIIKRKGIHHVLCLMRYYPACVLSIIGQEEGGYGPTLHNMTNKWGLASRVSYCGYLSAAQKIAILRRAHVIIMPSVCEGFGIAALEAMRYGCIPIVSTTTGIAQLITQGVNGFVVNPKHPKTMVRILHSLQHPEKLRQLRAQTQETWKQHPTWSQTFTPAINDLEVLCSPQPRRSDSPTTAPPS